MSVGGKRLMMGTPELQLVMSPLYVDHLGYPGEGPYKKVVRNGGGANNVAARALTNTRPGPRALIRVASSFVRTPSPLSRPQRDRTANVRLADEPGSAPSSSRSSSPDPVPEGEPGYDDILYDKVEEKDLEPVHLLSYFNRVSFIAKFKLASRQLRYNRKEYRRMREGTSVLEARGARGFNDGVSPITVGNRVRDSVSQIYETVSAHPEGEEQAAVVGRLIEHLPMPTRLALRDTSPMKIERYVFVRDAINVMRTQW